jgi:hypothetical protein
MSPRRAAGVGLLVLVFSAAGTGSAWASQPSARASCLGFESSAISPPGSSDELSGGRAELSSIVHELGDQLGVADGVIISYVAHLHEGSHEACDEATG